jgi:hypothetical protein
MRYKRKFETSAAIVEKLYKFFIGAPRAGMADDPLRDLDGVARNSVTLVARKL